MTIAWPQGRGLAALVVALALVGAGAFAQDAEAGFDHYCHYVYPAYGDCSGPRHSLNENTVQSGDSPHRVCAGALDGYSYTFYGSYLCGSPYRCHPYSGQRLLLPMARNGVSYSAYTQGFSWWGVDHTSGSCG